MANPTTAPTTGLLSRHLPKTRLPAPRLQPHPQPLQVLERLRLRALLRGLRPRLSRKALLLAAVGLAWSSQAAQAQIVREKPSQVKAANRRALRDARHTASPYKESHLGVTASRLRRGQSTQPLSEGSDELEYRKVTAPKAKSRSFQALRRKKKE